MYYFYEISTLNDYDWVEKEYKTIEDLIFVILKNMENKQYAMYSYSVSNKDSDTCIFSASLKTNTLFNKKISFIKTSAEEYKNTIIAHENIILLEKRC